MMKLFTSFSVSKIIPLTPGQATENKRDSLYLWKFHWIQNLGMSWKTDSWGPSSRVEFFRPYARKEKTLWELPLRIIWGPRVGNGC